MVKFKNLNFCKINTDNANLDCYRFVWLAGRLPKHKIPIQIRSLFNVLMSNQIFHCLLLLKDAVSQSVSRSWKSSNWHQTKIENLKTRLFIAVCTFIIMFLKLNFENQSVRLIQWKLNAILYVMRRWSGMDADWKLNA